MTSVNSDRAADEIREIERDLENLDCRHVELGESVKWLKFGFRVFFIALIAMAVSGMIIGNGGLIAVSVLAVLIAAVAAYVGPRSMVPGLASGGRELRWIDVVGWAPSGFLGAGVKRSEAMAIEDMVADRKARLALLKGVRP